MSEQERVPMGETSDVAPESLETSQDEGAGGEDFEASARQQGWVPQEKYRGDDREWVDAETFVRRGREINPILRANNTKLQKQLSDLQSKNKELIEAVNEFREYHAGVDKRAYERAVAQIESERRQAVKDGDVDRQFELEDELREVQAKEPKGEVKKIPVEQPEEFHPDFQSWMESNPWFGPDRLKTKLAMGLGEELREELGNTVLNASFLKELEVRLSEEFPKQFGKQFGNPNRNSPAMTSGTGRGGSTPTRGKYSVNDLPADARVIMAKFVKQGLLTEAQYLKDYFSDGDD